MFGAALACARNKGKCRGGAAKIAATVPEEKIREFARKPIVKSVLTRLQKALRSRAEYRQIGEAYGLKKPKKYARKMAKKQWDKLTTGAARRMMEQHLRQGKTGFPVKPPASMTPEEATELHRRRQASRTAIAKAGRPQVAVVQYAGHEPHAEGGHAIVYNPPLSSHSEKPRFDNYKKNRTGKVEKIAVHPSYIAGSTHGLYTVHTPKGKFAFIAPHDAIQQLARHSGVPIHRERLGKALMLEKAIRTVQYSGFAKHPSGEGHALLFHPPSPSGKLGTGSGTPGRTNVIQGITRHPIQVSNTHGMYSVHTASGNRYDFHAPHAEMSKLARATGKQIEGASRAATMPKAGQQPNTAPGAVHSEYKPQPSTTGGPNARARPMGASGEAQAASRPAASGGDRKHTSFDYTPPAGKGSGAPAAPGKWQPSPKGAPGSLGRQPAPASRPNLPKLPGSPVAGGPGYQGAKVPKKPEIPKPSGPPKPSGGQVIHVATAGKVSSTASARSGASASSIPATPPGTRHGTFQGTHDTEKGKGILFEPHGRPGKVHSTSAITSLKHVNDVQGSEATHGVYHATTARGSHFHVRMPHKTANSLARSNKLGSTGRVSAKPKAPRATKPKVPKGTAPPPVTAAPSTPALSAQGQAMRRWKMKKARLKALPDWVNQHTMPVRSRPEPEQHLAGMDKTGLVYNLAGGGHRSIPDVQHVWRHPSGHYVVQDKRGGTHVFHDNAGKMGAISRRLNVPIHSGVLKARQPTLAAQAGLPEPGGLHKGKHGQIVVTKTRKKDPRTGEMLYHVQGNIKDASGKLAVINHTGYTHFGAAMFAHHVQHGDIYNEGWLRRRLEGIKVPQVKKAIEAEFSLFGKAADPHDEVRQAFAEWSKHSHKYHLSAGNYDKTHGDKVRETRAWNKVQRLMERHGMKMDVALSKLADDPNADLHDSIRKAAGMEKAGRKIPGAKEIEPRHFKRLKDESEAMKQGPHPGPAAHETVPALAKWGTKKWVPEYDPTDDKRAKELTSYQVRLTHGVYHIHPREFNPSGAQEYLITFFGRDGTPQYVSGPKGCSTPAAAVREAKKHYEKVTTGWIAKAGPIAKAVLTAAKRHRLKDSQFGLPGKEAYPMPDKSHAANAKARATQMRKKGKLSAAEEGRIDRKANRVLGKAVEMKEQDQEQQPLRLSNHNAVVLDVTLKALLRKAQGQKLGPVTRRDISEPSGKRDQAHDADGQHFGPTSGRSVDQATGRKDQAHADDSQDPGPSTRTLTRKYTKKNRTGSQPEKVGRREGALTTGREEPDRIVKPKIRRES